MTDIRLVLGACSLAGVRQAAPRPVHGLVGLEKPKPFSKRLAPQSFGGFLQIRAYQRSLCGSLGAQ